MYIYTYVWIKKSISFLTVGGKKKKVYLRAETKNTHLTLWLIVILASF